ncbi:MAG TPA: hypothetical protein VF044_03595 [Actinomycetota bacterium]
MRELLDQLEAGGEDPTAGVVYLAAQSVEIADGDLRPARRRAMLLLAAGGDPYRELGPDDRAVTALAADLDAPGRREALEDALAALVPAAAGLPRVSGRLAELRARPGLAWRWLALVLLADELAGDDL